VYKAREGIKGIFSVKSHTGAASKYLIGANILYIATKKIYLK